MIFYVIMVMCDVIKELNRRTDPKPPG